MNIPLASCPFCGGQPYIRAPIHKGCEDIMIIECKQCGASPYSVYVSEVLDEADKRNAIAEKWNRRTKSTAHWIKSVNYEKSQYGEIFYKCSCCEFIVDYERPYCCNCGSKMEEK